MTIDSTRALRHLRGVEPRFRELIDAHGPPGYSRTRNSFRSLVRAIIYQQISGHAARSIHARFLALFESRGFPRPDQVAALDVDELREGGLSRQKATYIREVARAYVNGEIVPRRFKAMSDDDISAALTRIKGVGEWSAHMFLMFALNRPDVLPVGDLGVRKGMQRFYDLDELPAPAEMVERAGPWRPWRSVGSWYMWRVLEG